MCLNSQEFKAPSLQDYPECSLRRARGKRKALEGKRNTEIPTPRIGLGIYWVVHVPQVVSEMMQDGT